MAQTARGGVTGKGRRRFWFWTSACVMVAGLGLAAWALWIPVKAAIGQRLIDDAYQRARAGEIGARPWSWADHAPVAKLRFPSLGDAERVVLDQASNAAMAWAPGWMRGSAPLGAPGLSAVAAHRDTHFALLEGLKPGDVIELETVGGRRARYRMLRGAVVDSRSWRLPVSDHGPDLLALSTCWPFDALRPGPLRYVVFAAPEPAAVAEPPVSAKSPA